MKVERKERRNETNKNNNKGKKKVPRHPWHGTKQQSVLFHGETRTPWDLKPCEAHANIHAHIFMPVPRYNK